METDGNKNEFRITALLLEFSPLIILFFTAINSFHMFWPTILSLIYLFFGWYLFKNSDYSKSNTILSIVAGIYFVSLSSSILFIINSYPFGRKMIPITLIFGFILAAVLIYLYYNRRKSRLEYRFSLKLLSRVILFQIIGLNLLSSSVNLF